MLSDEEYRESLVRPAGYRYAYFVRSVVQGGHIWMLGDDESCLLAEDPDGRVVFPIWSHQRYALACARGIWERAEALVFDLDAFFSTIAPHVGEQEALFGIFMVPDGHAVHVESARLLTDMKDAARRLL